MAKEATLQQNTASAVHVMFIIVHSFMMAEYTMRWN